VLGEHSLCELDTAFEAAALPEEALPAAQLQLDAAGLDDRLGCAGAMRLRNIVPGFFLESRLKAADSVVLFSATLNPADYYTNLLGLPDATPLLDIACPFRPEQLVVTIEPISTRRQDRAATLDRLVQTMGAQFSRQPGNYLAFFSSFDYMAMAQQRLAQSRPDIPVWVQSRETDEAGRRAYLRRFQLQGQGIGFAVLGGVYGEGVDLPGSRLIGVFVATLGLPQFDELNQAICARMQDRFGRGYDYTYTYPGLQKVVQAAGRVIRTETDTGTVLLLDDRFLESRYRKLLPAWWQFTPASLTGSPA
jgi:Rad3-related DNA helicase